jgi:DNA-binding MarR family transcriptional regulator
VVDREALFEQLLESRACLVRGVGGMQALLRIELTIAQLKTLIYLISVRACPISQVADGLGIGRPAASLLIDRLVQLGLVRRGEDSTDRRRTLVELSDEGKTMAEELYEGSRLQMRELADQLSDADLEALVRGLNALAAVVNRGTSPEVSAVTAAAF